MYSDGLEANTKRAYQNLVISKRPEHWRTGIRKQYVEVAPTTLHDILDSILLESGRLSRIFSVHDGPEGCGSLVRRPRSGNTHGNSDPSCQQVDAGSTLLAASIFGPLDNRRPRYGGVLLETCIAFQFPLNVEYHVRETVCEHGVHGVCVDSDAHAPVMLIIHRRWALAP